jgi:hypothetical protein
MRQTSHREGSCVDASTLGIHPPNTVRLTIGDLVQDWPWHLVRVCGDRLELGDQGQPRQPTSPSATETRGMPLVYYPYEHAQQLDSGIWVLHRGEDMLVTPGPPTEPSSN